MKKQTAANNSIIRNVKAYGFNSKIVKKVSKMVNSGATVDQVKYYVGMYINDKFRESTLVTIFGN